MNKNNKSLAANEQALAAKFFAYLERQIEQRLRAEAATPEGRAALLKSTGVQDVQLIEELAKLGITADGLIALRLFPLVLVAWAEANVDDKERKIAMAEAKKIGIIEGSVAWILLDTWLTEPPRGISVDAWKRYVHAKFKPMSKAAQEKLIDLTKNQMHAVAKASGGHLGLGKVSEKEQLMILKLTSIMREQIDSREE